MIQITLDSVVCRAQFFCLQIVKNQNKRTNKNKKEQQPLCRDIVHIRTFHNRSLKNSYISTNLRDPHSYEHN